jgi:hypothetical protein
MAEEIGSLAPKMQQQDKAVISNGLCAGSTVNEWIWETSQRCVRGKFGTPSLLALPTVIL